jgi:hypothetical protein
MMKLIHKIFLLLPAVALLLAGGCSKSESFYGRPDNTPNELQLSASVSEADVLELKFDGTNLGNILPITFTWTPAAARGEAIEYLFRMDISTDEKGETVVRDTLGEHVYNRILFSDELFYRLRDDWKVKPDHGTVLLDISVIGNVRSAAEFIKPESSTIRIAVKMIR